MTKHVPDAHRCEHYALSVGRQCKQRGWLLVSEGNGRALWSCGSHAQMAKRDGKLFGNQVINMAVRYGECGAWWKGPVLPWPSLH
jgi:hypothetical protein